MRDFELDGLAEKRQVVRDICAAVKEQTPGLKLDLTFKEQYRNMRYWLEKDMRPVDLVFEVYEDLGITPITNPMRGGTDGAMLTERGLPTPNIFAAVTMRMARSNMPVWRIWNSRLKWSCVLLDVGVMRQCSPVRGFDCCIREPGEITESGQDAMGGGISADS